MPVVSALPVAVPVAEPVVVPVVPAADGIAALPVSVVPADDGTVAEPGLFGPLFAHGSVVFVFVFVVVLPGPGVPEFIVPAAGDVSSVVFVVVVDVDSTGLFAVFGFALSSARLRQPNAAAARSDAKRTERVKVMTTLLL
jgi:hypothetical protein